MRHPFRTASFRHAAALLLLAVFVSAWAASLMHVHAEAAQREVAACGAHCHKHHGHMAPAGHQADHCLLCQFLTVHYLPATAAPRCEQLLPTGRLQAAGMAAPQREATALPSPRAPPFMV